MAAAVLETLDEDGRAERMGAEGRRIAIERFDIRKAARAMERIYLTLLEGTGRRGP
jgi:glycosyltransferase involved in cell wall biosynthesis